MKTNNKDLYKGIILAPMVRTGFAPMRQLAIDLGASLVYTDVIVAKSLIKCKLLETNELFLYLRDDGMKVLQINKSTSNRTVVQIAGDDATILQEAVNLLKHQCIGIDLNLGCQKEFAVKNNMGGVLLEDRLKVLELLSKMRQVGEDLNLSCKIRLLDTIQSTVDLIKEIFKLGFAVALHCRLLSEDREIHQARTSELVEVIAQVQQYGTIIANGGFVRLQNIINFQTLLQQRSISNVPIMVARGAIRNPDLIRIATRYLEDGIILKECSPLEIYSRLIKIAQHHIFTNEQMKLISDDSHKLMVRYEGYRFTDLRACIMFGFKYYRQFVDQNDSQQEYRIVKKLIKLVADSRTLLELENIFERGTTLGWYVFLQQTEE